MSTKQDKTPRPICTKFYNNLKKNELIQSGRVKKNLMVMMKEMERVICILTKL